MAKYVDRRYVLRREEADPGRLYDAVKSRDLAALLQLYAEGADLAKPLVAPDGQVEIISNYCLLTRSPTLVLKSAVFFSCWNCASKPPSIKVIQETVCVTVCGVCVNWLLVCIRGPER